MIEPYPQSNTVVLQLHVLLQRSDGFESVKKLKGFFEARTPLQQSERIKATGRNRSLKVAEVIRYLLSSKLMNLSDVTSNSLLYNLGNK